VTFFFHHSVGCRLQAIVEKSLSSRLKMPLQELQAAQNDLLQLRDELKEAFGVLGCLNQIEAVCISDASVFEPQVFESIYTLVAREA
jgi:hypothetical protein